MSIKKQLECIESKIKDFDIDGASELIVELALDHNMYDISNDFISTNEITERLLERIGDDKESGWQSAYCMLSEIKSLNCEWYYLNGYNNIEHLTIERLEMALDELRSALEDQIEKELAS